MFINGLGRRYPSAANLCKTNIKEGTECAAVRISVLAKGHTRYQVATNAARQPAGRICPVLGSALWTTHVHARVVGYVHHADPTAVISGMLPGISVALQHYYRTSSWQGREVS